MRKFGNPGSLNLLRGNSGKSDVFASKIFLGFKTEFRAGELL